MKAVFVRVHKHGSEPVDQPAELLRSRALKSSSSTKNVLIELLKRKLLTNCEEWKFWDRSPPELSLDGPIPVRHFACKPDLTSPDLPRYVAEVGVPDIIWVEGRVHPAFLQELFELCPASFKVVYSKDWRPWKIEGLAKFDLCLVDEDWQAAKVERQQPGVRAAVWDKLIDYDGMHYPVPGEKKYDICYVAYLRRRKNHALLLEAAARLGERRLSCVLVGGGSSLRGELERHAAELGVSAYFTGEVAKQDVNRYINESRIGVICSKNDAAPRATLEYLAADVPVLVNAELVAGSRYVVGGGGVVRSPAEFHLGIAELLDHGGDYAPRAHVLEHYSKEKVIGKLVDAFARAGRPFG